MVTRALGIAYPMPGDEQTAKKIESLAGRLPLAHRYTKGIRPRAFEIRTVQQHTPRVTASQTSCEFG